MSISISIGHYCTRCRSSSCNHALQINEHNVRVQSDRIAMGGISMIPDIPITKVTETTNNKKLLLLLRRSK